MAEVTFVIKAMATLVLSLKKNSKSPSTNCKGKIVLSIAADDKYFQVTYVLNYYSKLQFSVDPRLWSQVVDIYPCLVECITCSSDDVREALKLTLFEFQDLLLHDYDNAINNQ